MVREIGSFASAKTFLQLKLPRIAWLESASTLVASLPPRRNTFERHPPADFAGYPRCMKIATSTSR